VYHVTTGGGGEGAAAPSMPPRYEIGGKPVTGDENVFAFRAAWTPAGFYTLRRKNRSGARRQQPADRPNSRRRCR